MTAHVVRADTRTLPLPDASVDLIITSPPYWQLRSYQDGGEHYDGQIGDEPTHRAYVDALLEATREWVRVLKPSGSMWINLGDKYGRGTRNTVSLGPNGKTGRGTASHVQPTGYDKSLMNLPARYAIAVTDELGLIQRAEIVWSKPNGLPESVTDRVRRSHEMWLHFTREPRYYDALDLIREPHADVSVRRALPHRSPAGRRGPEVYAGQSGQTLRLDQANHPLGRMPGSVWEVPTEPLFVPAVSPLDGRPLPDHFAAFPTEFPRRIITAFCPAEVCSRCGEGLRPVTDRTTVFDKARDQEHATAIAARGAAHAVMSGGTARSTLNGRTTRQIVGYVCGCDEPAAPTSPGVVLDPLGGTGTVALVADVLGRVGISVDLSHDYGRLARWRVTDPGERARAMRVDKPPRQLDGQADLFTMEG